MRGVLVTFVIGTLPRTILPWTLRTLTYQDANSLYSWAMSQRLPLRGFEWVSAPDEIDILNVPEDSKLGYILSGFGVPQGGA